MRNSIEKFELIWKRFVDNKGNMQNETDKLNITVGNLKHLSQQFFDQGVKFGKEIADTPDVSEDSKNRAFDFFNDIFKGSV